MSSSSLESTMAKLLFSKRAGKAEVIAVSIAAILVTICGLVFVGTQLPLSPSTTSIMSSLGVIVLQLFGNILRFLGYSLLIMLVVYGPICLYEATPREKKRLKRLSAVFALLCYGLLFVYL